MIPSASNAAPPIIAGIISHLARFLKIAYSEKIPPSPLLSALRVIITYFIVVCNVNVQKISETAPKMAVLPIMFPSPMIAFIVYNGEVPISP